MKIRVFGTAFALLVISCVLMSCVVLPINTTVVKGNGNHTRAMFVLASDYTAVSVQEGITVLFVDPQTGEFSIDADENVMEYVSVVERDGRVKVSYEPGIVFREHGVKTVVTMPLSAALTRLDVSSSGKIESRLPITGDRTLHLHGSSSGDFVLDAQIDKIKMEMSSSADFRGNVSVREFEAVLSSSADVRVSGRAKECTVKASSSADFKGYDIVCEEVDADVSSSGSIEITVTEKLDAEASSGGDIRYKGSPEKVKKNSSSGGSVKAITN